MNFDAENVDSLIVCASSANQGPCKVKSSNRVQSTVSSVVYLTFTLYILSQGDSGGPLTVKNEDDAHTLLGIVSEMLPLDTTCKDQEYAVFTSIAGFLPWIKASIKDNGGMASCDASLTVPPSKGCSNDQTKNAD